MINANMDIHGTYLIPYSMFIRDVEDQNLNTLANKSWPCRHVDSSNAKFVYRSSDEAYAYFIHDSGTVYISTNSGTAYINVASKDESKIQGLFDFAQKLAPRFEETDDDKVEVTFWSMTPNGPNQISRSLDVPDWKSITPNYTFPVKTELDKFINQDFRPSRGGQLMLWYGVPGTGKTTALRALAREWRDWCEMHYIADPEVFFGSRADYMMNVLINGADDDKWRLLILEDCGELLLPDAREQSGQGLSRFLNAVDGLIGQGLRFMVLVTTNEPLSKLNPAVARPGRCLAQIEFDALTPDETLAWLQAHKVEVKNNLPNDRTIAQLYAKKESFGSKVKKNNKPVGFSA